MNRLPLNSLPLTSVSGTVTHANHFKNDLEMNAPVSMAVCSAAIPTAAKNGIRAIGFKNKGCIDY